MRPEYQSLAEFLRHPGTRQEEVTDFYTRVVGLPVMRSYPQIQMLWAGEDLAFELKYDTEPVVADDADPLAAPLVPLLRSHDLGVTRARLEAAGYPAVLQEEDEHSETFYVLGPDRQVTGFQQRAPGSPLAEDQAALARWRGGPASRARLPGVGPMAAELQYLHRIVLHASDVERTSDWLARGLGLDQVVTEGANRVHSFGDTVVLQVTPGGTARPAPSDRNEATAAVILRIHDLDAFTAAALAGGAVAVGDLVGFANGVRLRYFADPDGIVFGVVQRGHSDDGVEDEEAARRWAARAGSVTS